MYGWEAISENNGLAISIVGITIVFTGLVGLSLIISQLHKLVFFWEHKGKKLLLMFARQKTQKAGYGKKDTEKGLNPSEAETLKKLQLLSPWLGQHFSLDNLLALAEKRGLLVKDSTLKKLINQGSLEMNPDGTYTWKTKK